MTSIQRSTEGYSQRNWARERNKGYSNWKQRSQVVPVCNQHDIIYRKLKTSPEKLLEVINRPGVIVGFKKQHRKSLMCLYTNGVSSEIAHKRIPIIITIKT